MSQVHKKRSSDNLYIDTIWQTQNLEDGVYLATPDGSWDLIVGIDENGIIAGWGNINGIGQVPIVWTPVPEPGTFLVLSAGIVILFLRKKK